MQNRPCADSEEKGGADGQRKSFLILHTHNFNDITTVACMGVRLYIVTKNSQEQGIQSEGKVIMIYACKIIETAV